MVAVHARWNPESLFEDHAQVFLVIEAGLAGDGAERKFGLLEEVLHAVKADALDLVVDAAAYEFLEASFQGAPADGKASRTSPTLMPRQAFSRMKRTAAETSAS